MLGKLAAMSASVQISAPPNFVKSLMKKPKSIPISACIIEAPAVPGPCVTRNDPAVRIIAAMYVLSLRPFLRDRSLADERKRKRPVIRLAGVIFLCS